MDKITVLDNGGQYTHLIATKIRELKVYSEILQSDVKASKLEDSKAIILSGSPYSVYDKDAPPFNTEIFELDIPILGLCYGLQLMAYHLGGEVKSGQVKEYGMAELEVEYTRDLFQGLRRKEPVWMSHGDAVKKMPKGFKRIGFTYNCPYAAFGDPEKKYYGLQFHPEVDNTPKGMHILSNFAYEVSGCKPTWTMGNFVEEKSKVLRKEARDKNVFLLVSGGVDSTVAAVLLERSLSADKVFALHIDNGLMRKGESEQVEKELKKLGFKNIFVVDASEDFFKTLGDETDPEKKREIIGTTFIDVANREAEKLGLKNWLLGQGTIYPDTIESGGTKHADVIKTHHNRVLIIQQMIEEGKIIEPLKELYKAEVRDVGVELGLPEKRVWRHPFPGPGLGIRALCTDDTRIPEDVNELSRRVNDISSSFNMKGIVLPIKNVGVKGDSRSYEYSAAVFRRKTDWDELEQLSTRLVNEVREINRVVYSIIPENINDVSIVKSTINRKRMDMLREADYITMKNLDENNLMRKVWQCPTILIPISINNNGESIVLRPVYSKRAMTARFADLPWEVVNKTAKEIVDIDGIGTVLYDITHKPPGTIEWE